MTLVWTPWNPEPTLPLFLDSSGPGQGDLGKLLTLKTLVQLSLPSACHSLSTDGATHLGVSVTLCLDSAEGNSTPGALRLSLSCRFVGAHPLASASFVCPLSTGVHV